MKLEQLDSSLQALCDGLESLTEERRFSEIWGAHAAPPLTTGDLAVFVSNILEKVRAIDWNKTDKDVIDNLNTQKSDIDICTASILPHLSSQQFASFSLISLLASLDSLISASIGTGELKGTLVLPFNLHRRTKHAIDRLEQSSDAIDDIERKLQQIKSAYDAAENLPSTQKDLEDALTELERTKKAALTNELASKASAEEALSKKEELDKLVTQAQSVLQKVNEAYRAATTQGLAQAFSKRQAALSKETWIWVVFLALSLAGAGAIGHFRFPAILSALSANPQWGVVGINMAISALSLAPAVWFAWMATKQIGQRFRLAEDYGYKAALATAYEGYRNEAARLDPLFEAQLFSTALGRLDEIPLRLVEPDAPGSPMHELFKSQEFMSATEVVPGFKQRIVSFLKRSPATKANEAVVIPTAAPEAAKE